MKKAVIICILSLSMCLSQAKPPADVNLAAAGVVASNGTSENAVKKDDKIVNTASVTPVTNQQGIPETPEASEVTKQGGKTAEEKIEDIKNKKKQTETLKPIEKSTETPKKEKLANETILPNTSLTNTSSSANATSQANATNPASELTPAGGKVETSTPHADTPKTSEAPKAVTEKPSIQAARGFDGGSFIGGIILTLGLLAIGFMGYKYYKNQTERNYHTL